MSRLVCLLVWLACAFSVRAQDVAMVGTLPDSIVVTASRYAEDARRTGRRVTVWTAADLARLPVASFDELLRTVGVVELQSRGGFGVQSDVTLRGSTFNGVLVLLDGARINDPMTGHFFADLPVPLSEIARIEVLRGPATVLYGPDALGGVIQLFTFTGLRTGRAAETLGGSAEVQGGRYGLYHVDAVLRGAVGTTHAAAATTWQGSDGMPVEDASGRPVVGPDGAVRTDFTRRAHTAALAAPLAGATLYARAGMDDRDFGAYHFYTNFASDTAREATSTYWAQVRLASDDTPTAWRVQAAAKQHEDEYVYNPQTPANRHTSRLLTLQAQASRRLHARLTASAGASAERRAIDSNNLGRHADVAAGAFAFVRAALTHDLTLNAGGRLDYDPGYGLEATPQASLAYMRGGYTLRAGAGRAVRAPNYVERYINTTLASPRGRSLGNPDLRPERAWSFEAGADLYPAAGLALHATAFHRDVDDLIDYLRLTPADTVWLARNLLSVRTRGVELEAYGQRDLGAAARLRLSASYTGLDADVGGVREGVEYKYVLTHARHLVQATAAVDVGAATFGVQGLGKERLTGEAYGVVNVRFGYGVPLGRQRLAFSAEVRNLFDVEYAEVFDAPMPRRWWLAGIRLSR